MADIKLPQLPDRTPVKLSISVMPDLHQALADYAALYAQTYGRDEPVAELISAMLATFSKATAPSFANVTPGCGGRNDRAGVGTAGRAAYGAYFDRGAHHGVEPVSNLGVDPGGVISRSRKSAERPSSSMPASRPYHYFGRNVIFGIPKVRDR
jgi:hypothetical protein